MAEPLYCDPQGTQELEHSSRDVAPARRSVLKGVGAALAAAATYGTLDLNEAFAQTGAAVMGGAVDVGNGDFGILNFAYALEQLESAFYSTIVERPYRGMTRYEAQVFTGIRNNEVAHRDFLRNTLGFAAIPNLQVDFSRVDFGSRQTVLMTSRMFEDLGVSAYNGAGPLIRNPQFLAAAGSIVSVEARQAAIIRDIISPYSRSFAGDDIVDRNGLETPPRLPSQVLPKVAPFILTPVSASQLP